MPRNEGGSTPAQEVMLLFLDIDGVLHPVHPRDDRPEAECKAFCYLATLERVLREFPDVRIVISSDWRKHHTLAELRRFFSEDLRFRIAGVISIDDEDHERGNRQRLVERYLLEHNMETAAWIALDDDDGNYLAGAPLVLCDDGVREAEEQALRAALIGQPIRSRVRATDDPVHRH